MPTKEKPYLKSWSYLGVHTVEPVQNTEYWDSQAGHAVASFLQKCGTTEPLCKEGRNWIYRLPASHIITLCSDQWHWCFTDPRERSESKTKEVQEKTTDRDKNGNLIETVERKFVTVTKTWIDGVDLADPNQDVCKIIWARRRVLGRNPGATFIFHGDHLYHVLTWPDVIGKSRKESRLAKTKDKKIILFAQRRTPQETEEFLELYAKEDPEQRVSA